MAHIKVNDLEPRAQYVSTAGQTTFVVPFPFFQNSDVKARAGDDETPLNPVLYTLTGALEDAGGTLVFEVGRTLDERITITRESEIKRVTDFNAGGFSSKNINDDLDKGVT